MRSTASGDVADLARREPVLGGAAQQLTEREHGKERLVSERAGDRVEVVVARNAWRFAVELLERRERRAQVVPDIAGGVAQPRALALAGPGAIEGEQLELELVERGRQGR